MTADVCVFHAADIVGQLRDAEIEDLAAFAAGDLVIGDEENILGLEIAMNDAARVRRAERARDLAHDPQRVGDRQSPQPTDALIERLARQQLHHEIGAAVGVVAEVEDLHDPRIRDRRRRACLVEEAGDDLGPRREAPDGASLRSPRADPTWCARPSKPTPFHLRRSVGGRGRRRLASPCMTKSCRVVGPLSARIDGGRPRGWRRAPGERRRRSAGHRLAPTSTS